MEAFLWAENILILLQNFEADGKVWFFMYLSTICEGILIN